MHSKLIKFAAAGAVTLSLLGAAGMAQASSLTTTQVSAIIGLLQSFGADSTTIANVQSSLNGQPTNGNSDTHTNNGMSDQNNSVSCVTLSANLGVGSKGAQVSSLQTFLNLNPTGYFGAQTKAAVQNWQTAHGISAAGNVGPATRASMGCGNHTSMPDSSLQTYTNSQYGFSVQYPTEFQPQSTTNSDNWWPLKLQPVLILVSSTDRSQTVKIGVSTNTTDCIQNANDYRVTIAGVGFYVFESTDPAAGQEGFMRTYSGMKDGTCYKLNVSFVGSEISHMDTSAQKDAELLREARTFKKLGAILESLKFTGTSDQSVSVPGMSQYTDTDFGFSFWYPSNYHVSSDAASGVISVSGGGDAINIKKVFSSDLSYKVGAGACGTCNPKTYYFDTSKHLWMLNSPDGGIYAPASGGQPADISINTMGGLHIFNGQDKSLNKIVPLSARNFLSITKPESWTGAPYQDAELVGFTKTILATDPSVATPWSTVLQAQTILEEKNAFSGQ